MLYQNLTKHLAQKLQLTLSRQHLFCFNVSQDKIFYFYKLFVKFSDNWNDTQIFELSLDCFFYKHHLFFVLDTEWKLFCENIFDPFVDEIFDC